MNNYLQSGQRLQITAPTGGFTAGACYKTGDSLGVAETTVAGSEEGILLTEGVFTLPKAAVAFTQGNRVWWDDSAKAMTTVTGGNTLAGIATTTVASGVTTAPVRLNGSF
jgi:predicted RecA/RadA family phage recombinase